MEVHISDLFDLGKIIDSGQCSRAAALLSALRGVRAAGVKVASCVALFAYGRTGCAPVDTWIQKVIRQEYQGRSPFPGHGADAGIMQQSLFCYALHGADGPA